MDPAPYPRAQTHMTFGKDFTQAVEQKQIAQQGAYGLAHTERESVVYHEIEADTAYLLGSRVDDAQRPSGPSSSSSG